MNCDGIALCGDLNSDFSRHSGFVNNINMSMNNHDLQSLWNMFNVDYTYRHTDEVSTSTIDHFIVSNRVFLINIVVVVSPTVWTIHQITVLLICL